MLKSLEYSIRYILLIIIFYYLGVKVIYQLNFFLLALIPVNFLAIHYGILYKIKKDNYVTKYYILMSLVVFTSIFSFTFLYLNRINIWVIVIAILINVIELIFLDLPKEKLFEFVKPKK